MEARVLAEKGAPDWTVVVSETQTMGRGSKGRNWESRKGGLWFSVILRPLITASKVSLLQFLASNATRRAVEEKTGLRALAKWPNDLVLGEGKLAGILIESRSIGDRVSFVIVGIGLNVNQGKRHLPRGARSIYESSGRKHSLPGLLRTILDHIRSGYQDLCEPVRILEEWWLNCVHRGVRVEVETSNGVVKGICTGVDLDGSLIVQTNRHVVERIVEGTLHVRNN